MLTTKIGRLATLSSLILLLTICSAFAGDFLDSWAQPGVNVEPDEIYIKIQADYAPLMITADAQTSIASLDAASEQFNITEIEKTHYVPERVKSNPYADDMDRWYTVHFPSSVDVRDVRTAYETCPEVEYSEFITIDKMFYRPDDPRERVQWYIQHMNFWDAWDVTRGSRDVVIGIVDSGLDMNAEGENSMVIHEDLADNIWLNLGEDVNGDGRLDIEDWNMVDDDDNGYLNDFHGWDFECDDNWPDDWWGESDGHGTHVAGIASAATDNNIGIAGAAFSAQLMIAACYDRRDSTSILHGYEGIFYCAVNGANVINLSWGGDTPYWQNSYETIQFAINEGSILFAGCGNDDVEDYEGRATHFYPAGYDGVIGVSASDQDDNKADFATYGDFVDVVTPGVDIVSTVTRNSYVSWQGTSMSSPLACGLGALLLSVLPDLTTDDMLRLMQESAVDISAQNRDYNGIQYRLDAGELLNRTHPSFDVTEFTFTEEEGDDDGRFETSEQISFDFSLMNLPSHAEATNITYRFYTDDPTLRITNATGNLGDLLGGRGVNVETLPVVEVSWSQPHYAKFYLNVTSDEGWNNHFEFPVTINHPYYLLIDDDNGDNFERYYEEDLAVTPLVHDSYNMANGFWPPAVDWMSEFEVVIWYTGNDQEPLNEDDVLTIQQYLDAGGKLILSGQYIGDTQGNSELFSDYLHVQHISDNVNDPQMNGVAGDAITDTLSLFLIGGSAAGNNRSPSSCEPLEGAHSIFNYNASGATAATYFENETFTCIYLGFAFEAASGLGGTSSRLDFLTLALEEIAPVSVDAETPALLPSAFSLSEAWPNPFNPTTEISVNVPTSDLFNLTVFDIQGRQIETLFNGNRSAGVHQFLWNGDDKPAGEYLFRLNWQSGTDVKKALLLK